MPRDPAKPTTPPRMRAACRLSCRVRRALEPTTEEAGAPQAAADHGIAAHRAPHEAAAMVLHHREDRALVDAEVVGRDPTEAGLALAPMQARVVVLEARVER